METLESMALAPWLVVWKCVLITLGELYVILTMVLKKLLWPADRWASVMQV